MERLNESRIGAVITEAFAARASAFTASTFHASHGAGIIVGLEGDVTATEPGRGVVRGRAVVMPPHLWHSAASDGPTVAFLFDPELAPHVAGYSRSRGGAFPLEGRLAARLLEAVAAHRASLSRPEVLVGLAHETSRWLEPGATGRAPDRRVARLLESLRDPSADRRVLTSGTRVSQAHLRALFVRDVGLPIRTFQLWHRLIAALAAFARLDATSAAHAAGFADLAHFSRTCRRMLGYAPTALRDGLLSESEEERLQSPSAWPRPGSHLVGRVR